MDKDGVSRDHLVNVDSYGRTRRLVAIMLAVSMLLSENRRHKRRRETEGVPVRYCTLVCA